MIERAGDARLFPEAADQTRLALSRSPTGVVYRGAGDYTVEPGQGGDARDRVYPVTAAGVPNCPAPNPPGSISRLGTRRFRRGGRRRQGFKKLHHLVRKSVGLREHMQKLRWPARFSRTIPNERGDFLTGRSRIAVPARLGGANCSYSAACKSGSAVGQGDHRLDFIRGAGAGLGRILC